MKWDKVRKRKWRTYLYVFLGVHSSLARHWQVRMQIHGLSHRLTMQKSCLSGDTNISIHGIVFFFCV